MSWILVKAVCAEPPSDWSPIIDAFVACGIEATLEEEDGISGAYAEVAGVEVQINALRGRLTELGVDQVIVEPYQEVDWETAWKQFFKPRRVGEHFVIRPTWESFEAGPGDRVIVLDPGQAFGTGDHPTTRMCLAHLERHVAPEKRVLDLGCGSGILAIGAKLLGAQAVLAIDIDSVAVEVAKENFERNSVAVAAQVGDVLGLELDAEWDVVVSNIISATLINLAPDAAFSLRPGGIWITSGIIDQNWPDVKAAAEKCGLSVIDETHEDGWTAGVFQK